MSDDCGCLVVDENSKRRHQRDDGTACPPARSAANAAWPMVGCRHDFHPCSMRNGYPLSVYPGG